jgi:hypothetical protein
MIDICEYIEGGASPYFRNDYTGVNCAYELCLKYHFNTAIGSSYTFTRLSFLLVSSSWGQKREYNWYLMQPCDPNHMIISCNVCCLRAVAFTPELRVPKEEHHHTTKQIITQLLSTVPDLYCSHSYNLHIKGVSLSKYPKLDSSTKLGSSARRRPTSPRTGI